MFLTLLDDFPRGGGSASSRYRVAGAEPTLVADFARNTFLTRALSEADYVAGGATPTLIVDAANNFYGVTTL
jgi:hypothetical protein